MTAQAPMSLFDGSALARATRSFLRRLVDPIIESRQRKAEEFLAEYIGHTRNVFGHTETACPLSGAARWPAAAGLRHVGGRDPTAWRRRRVPYNARKGAGSVHTTSIADDLRMTVAGERAGTSSYSPSS